MGNTMASKDEENQVLTGEESEEEYEEEPEEETKLQYSYIFVLFAFASIIGIFIFAIKNKFNYDKTMANGGDWIVFLICVKVLLIFNGMVHVTPSWQKRITESQGLEQNEASKMYESELGALCLSAGIFVIMAGSSVETVATISKVVGCFFLYCALRHLSEGQPVGTAIGGLSCAVLQLAAGFHAAPNSVQDLKLFW